MNHRTYVYKYVRSGFGHENCNQGPETAYAEENSSACMYGLSGCDRISGKKKLKATTFRTAVPLWGQNTQFFN